MRGYFFNLARRSGQLQLASAPRDGGHTASGSPGLTFIDAFMEAAPVAGRETLSIREPSANIAPIATARESTVASWSGPRAHTAAAGTRLERSVIIESRRASVAEPVNEKAYAREAKSAPPAKPVHSGSQEPTRHTPSTVKKPVSGLATQQEIEAPTTVLPDEERVSDTRDVTAGRSPNTEPAWSPVEHKTVREHTALPDEERVSDTRNVTAGRSPNTEPARSSVEHNTVREHTAPQSRSNAVARLVASERDSTLTSKTRPLQTPPAQVTERTVITEQTSNVNVRIGKVDVEVWQTAPGAPSPRRPVQPAPARSLGNILRRHYLREI